jgi:hypothetical protein
LVRILGVFVFKHSKEAAIIQLYQKEAQYVASDKEEKAVIDGPDEGMGIFWLKCLLKIQISFRSLVTLSTNNWDRELVAGSFLMASRSIMEGLRASFLRLKRASIEMFKFDPVRCPVGMYVGCGQRFLE